MIIDWITREGWIIASWWLLVTVVGWTAVPLALRLLPGLPDRGYTFARAIGLLLVGWVFWILGSTGFLGNTQGDIVFAWLIVFIVALFMYFKGERIDLRQWWRDNRTMIIVVEVLFFALFVSWCVYRAHQNEITSTEKPMELAFISGIMRSESFPPNDPWMSGYSISYYYFGYVIAAMLAKLSGVSSTYAMNMTISLLFALTGVTAFGVVYNLARSHQFASLRKRVADASQSVTDIVPRVRGPIFAGVFGLIFVVLMSNFQFPLIEIPYQTGTASAEYLRFLDTDNRQDPLPSGNSNFLEWGDWWWFRSARVLNDRYLDGVRQEVIDEFPQFSYLLADVHPHVLSLPFAVMALGLALNVLLRGRPPKITELVFYGLVIGGLVFLNTWDGPIYAAGILGAEGLRRLMGKGRGRLGVQDLVQIAIQGVTIGAVALIAYLPFLISFRSQAGGLIPNLIFPTPFQQFFINFGPLFVILTIYLAIEAWRGEKRLNTRLALQFLAGFALAIVGIIAIIALLMATNVEFAGWLASEVRGTGTWDAVLGQILSKRVTHSVTTIVLVLGLMVVIARLFPRLREDEHNDAHSLPIITYSPATGFVLLLVGMGLVLTLVPDYFYLRDYFGTRMNTVFKFYYQAWLLWSLAAAFAVYEVVLAGNLPSFNLRQVSGVVRAGLAGATLVVVTLGLLFVAVAPQYRMFSPMAGGLGSSASLNALTLDGGTRFTSGSDYAAVQCLQNLVGSQTVVVAESIAGSYSGGQAGRTATLTGIPVVLNWPGHESQWRGSTYGAIAGSREADIERLYSELSWPPVESIAERYGIDYIMFGTAEANRYGWEAEIKFRDNLEVVCDTGGSRYYRVDQR